jgi:tetratricopeptide (TPR) repeat protein
MKRPFLKSAFLAVTLLVAASCAQKLEVQPLQSVDAVSALTTSGDVTGALIGAYDGIQSVNVYGGAFQYIPDLLGDNGEIRFAGTFSSHIEIYNKAMTSNNTQVTATWNASYNAINRTNNVLANLSKVTEATRNRVEGEARCLRAMVYFELVRLYAKTWGDGDPTSNPGVPLVLTPTKIVDPTPSDIAALAIRRNSVAEVYAQVIDDLTKAESLLPDNNNYYANKALAAGMLSRVYLMQQEYAKARDAANRVIASGLYPLMGDWTSLFNNFLNTGSSQNPPEYIFMVRVTEQDGVSDLNTFYGLTLSSVPNTAGRNDILILNRHLQLYERGDVRGTFFVREGRGVSTLKYVDRFGNVPVMRLAEMILTRAECNFRLRTAVGDTPENDVNIIRQRVGLAPLTTLTLDAILRERKLELAFEGFLLHDLKRTRRPVSNTLPWNSPKLILPIPQRETDANPNLTQNEGY